jgi:hypothetical protein
MEFVRVHGALVAVPPITHAQKPDDLDAAVISESALNEHIQRLKGLLIEVERAKDWTNVAELEVEQNSLVRFFLLAVAN